MTEGVTMSTENEAAAAEARALEQARIRKERREAKIRAGGASRLNKISGLGGGLQREAPPQPPPPQPTETTSPNSAAAAAASRQQQQQTHADPEEVDISEHYYQPQPTSRLPPFFPPQQQQQQQPLDPGTMSEAQLRQMMLGLDMPGLSAPGFDGSEMEDPMMKMMMQMMGGGGNGTGAGAPPFPFPFPPNAGAAGNTPQQTPLLPNRYASLWRLLHTAVALGLGLYIALWTTFSGSKLERDGATSTSNTFAEKETHESAKHFFWAFATAEAVLLTSRFFLDRRRAAADPMGGGVLGLVVGFLPPKVKSYVEIAMTYGQIFSTVKADVLVCIFVLGVCSWART
ncbi:hypothetical protein B0T19DRAFT_260637 [Cercophora scortea]|uniref:Uncharacterized protein n=1 Tax=Cercophora scortea TaxID=314031 RepID=A0AAE0M797_9PEZI|nr:hypothetical protein B0T19DRAFT_260637 [Cercophora scortea]